MPHKYTFKTNGYDSSYESDGGTKYFPHKELGKGNYSRAREFKSTNDKKTAVILNPNSLVNIDFDEVYTKYEFFKCIYSNRKVDLFKTDNDYRLITPSLPGILYSDLDLTTQEQQINLFLATVLAIKDCHQKGYIIIDLKLDNILYDAASNRSYLIDGGLSQKERKFIPELFWIDDENKKGIEWYRKNYPHIAPECWSSHRVLANKTMDIYSLGKMMVLLPDPSLRDLAQPCLNQIIASRPTLDSLEKSLKLLQKSIKKPDKTQVPLENLNNEHRILLQNKTNLSPRNNINLQVLGGFMAVIGSLAVAAAFILLNDKSYHNESLIISGIGVAATIAGIGLFAIGTYRNVETQCTSPTMDASMSV